MSEENKAILKVSRFIPNGMELANDGSKWYLVIMGQVYAIDVNFHAILEVAKDWYIKANREDSSLDAESVVITVCDAFEEALTAAQNSGATQYVRSEQAPDIYPPAVERAVQRAITSVASKSDIVTLNQVTLGALSETSNPYLRGSKTKSTGLTIADIQRSAVQGAIASNYPASASAAVNPYATPPPKRIPERRRRDHQDRRPGLWCREDHGHSPRHRCVQLSRPRARRRQERRCWLVAVEHRQSSFGERQPLLSLRFDHRQP